MRNNPIKSYIDIPMTPAACAAVVSGNLDNYLAASMPGGIEMQEKKGQLQQAAMQTLPVKGTDRDRDKWESIGFVFGEPQDDIFVNVTFPAGWSKRPTDHSMWSDLVDDKGRCRAKIFYKAAFYDRSAHISFETRFKIETKDYTSDPRVFEIKDEMGVVKLESAPFRSNVSYREEDHIRQLLLDELAKQFPDWRSPLAYWD